MQLDQPPGCAHVLISCTQVSLDGLSADERTGLFINLYNAIIIHGTVVFGFPETAGGRAKFFKGLTYAIGGYIFSTQVCPPRTQACGKAG